MEGGGTVKFGAEHLGWYTISIDLDNLMFLISVITP